MTKRDIDKLSAAILRVAQAGEVNRLTLRAIVQSIRSEFDGDRNTTERNLRNFTWDATGVVDLSGIDYLARIGAR